MLSIRCVHPTLRLDACKRIVVVNEIGQMLKNNHDQLVGVRGSVQIVSVDVWSPAHFGG